MNTLNESPRKSQLVGGPFQLSLLASMLGRSSSTAAILRGARREVQQHDQGVSIGTKGQREAIELITGWRPAISASKSAPILPLRGQPTRFRALPLAPIASPLPPPAPPNPPAPPILTATDESTPSPRRSSPLRKPLAKKASPVFLSPQRDTNLLREGDQFDCAAPGYYDRSVFSAPWSMAGGVPTTRLSSSFLASGRQNTLPAAMEQSTPLAAISEPAHQQPAELSADGPSAAVSDAQAAIETRGSRNKLRRQQREVAALQSRARQMAGKKILRGSNDLHKDMSPSSMHAAEASFEHRLQRSTVVPATDRAIEVLVKMSRAAGNDLSAVDFAANPGSLYPNSPQVDRSSRHTTLSFQSSAFRS